MTLYLIGLGLNDKKDISLKGLEIVKKCSKIYLENYTSVLSCSKEDLEKLYGKEVVLADRYLVEQKAGVILDESKSKDVAFLVMGDPLTATTHTDLVLRAKEMGVEVQIVHNACILNAIAETGLQLYKFGKTTSIPFENSNVKAPVEVLKANQSIGLHTLFLLDLDPKNDKFLTIKQAIEYLVKNGVDEDILGIGCARISAKDQVIKAGKLKDIKEFDYGKPPYCLIIPGKLHFMEEEFLNKYI